MGDPHALRKETASVLLLRSRYLLEVDGDLRLATVEAVSAAETAVSEFLQSGSPEATLATLTSEGFRTEDIRDRLRVLAALVGIPEVLLANAIGAFDFRNQIVHSGWEPDSVTAPTVTRAVESLLEVVCRLVGGTECRQVSATPGGSKHAPDKWEREYREGTATPPRSARQDIRW
jgi:hypothetical protein